MKMRKTITQNPIEISRVLRRIEKKIDILVGGAETKRPTRKREETMGSGEGLDIMTLLSFPDHLRKSAMTIIKLGKAMAEDVAKETGRARAIESAYLNQLVRMGYVKKGREGRRVYFSVEGNQASVELLVKENVAIEGG
jgi:predicted transcriptional regulator